MDPVSPVVTIPNTDSMVGRFSTPESGWSNPWNCNADFSGTPYAGLWAILRCVEGSSRASGDETDTRLSITKVETRLTIESAE